MDIECGDVLVRGVLRPDRGLLPTPPFRLLLELRMDSTSYWGVPRISSKRGVRCPVLGARGVLLPSTRGVPGPPPPAPGGPSRDFNRAQASAAFCQSIGSFEPMFMLLRLLGLGWEWGDGL